MFPLTLSDTFPDTEVAEDPAGQKTHGQLPAHTAHLLDASGHAQRPLPEKTGELGNEPSKALVHLYSQNSVATEVAFGVALSFVVTLATP